MPVFSDSYQVTHNGVDLQITPSDLKEFADVFIRDANVIERCSERFVLDLYVYANTSGLNPAIVIEEVQALESSDKQSKTKPELMFTRQPLKGLWHKHFFSRHFLAQNMLLAHGNGRIDRKIEQVFAKYEGIEGTVDNFRALVREVRQGSSDLYKDRQDQSRLTGEWIVFIKHEGLNYYICIDFHLSGDQNIYNKVLLACEKDFPELKQVVENYA
ncbi:hypothetical protein ACI1G1_003448 [Vibrio cholerae]|uniref:hypothetical protein n=1 Tax=Vibrio TaxID=662 RepID=UPI0005B40DAB|nr:MULTISPECIES: hypothetical protein [Vibrio]EGR0143991.1 hypothetical protein [Vibrio cholerae]EKF9814079.1 hypothetical protein [Vibrio cholerae]RBM37499.1 hypothetical protein DLR62_15735 [Vibrio tarriae]